MTDALRLLQLQRGLVLRTEIHTRVHRRIDLAEGRVHDGQQVQVNALQDAHGVWAEVFHSQIIGGTRWGPSTSPGRQAEAGLAVKELCRANGFSDATFYKWRAKFGGMQAGEATRLREIETENGKLKKLLAEAHLHIEALKVGFGSASLGLSSCSRSEAATLRSTCCFSTAG